MDRGEPQRGQLTQVRSNALSEERSGSRFRAALFLSLLPLLVAASPSLRAQTSTEGSTGAVVGTALLGAYSGTTLGLTGALVPCSTTVHGLTCSRIAAGAGAVVGAVSGAAIGNVDRDFAMDHVRGAAVGAVIGLGTGLVLKELVRQYGWLDAGAGALLGGAIGAAPKGAGIGAASGAVAGIALWALVPAFEPGDVVGLTLMGMAVGGLTQWIIDAARAGDPQGQGIPVTFFSLPVP